MKILNRLKENFAPVNDHEPIIKAPTENIDAYNLYLKGLYHWNRSKPEEIDKAIKNFEEAVKIDSKYANAYCALSYCYSLKGSSGWMSITEAYAKAKDFALKAIELDPNNPNSHLSLGTIKFFHNWEQKLVLKKVSLFFLL